MRLSVLSCLLALSLAAQTAAPDQVTDWIKSNAIPLSTVEAGHGSDDMQPLKKIVGDARIVSLGEATHGSREFFQLKHRMLEFLATQMGFTIFSIEANMPEAYRLNDYVLKGNGDPMKLIKGMYLWTWDTEEVLDMVRWMRDFNKSGKGRAEFTGFDMQTPNVAAQIVRDFVAKADPAYVPTLLHALVTALAPTSRADQSSGTAAGYFPVEAAAGKKMRVSGYIKTQDVRAYAGLWLRADVGGKLAGIVNLKDAPSKTTDWKRYTMELSIPKDATTIYFGPLLVGPGKAWFDDLEIDLDGKPYKSPNFDFTFEGPSLTGLSSSEVPFPSRLDSQVSHTGQKSLLIENVPFSKEPNAVDSKVASAEWKTVVDHLTQSKERYLRAGIAAKEIDWAAQNARVVWQCMQMRADEVTRDASMAANVKWILGQSPNAKIVLWAHNGHVGNSYDGSMGSALRTEYGKQMVVFGFAFNQGSFHAIPQGGGFLKSFTVPPAPAESLDATLASSGIPLFALDLRTLPKDGPVADWFSKGHATRTVGATYPENSPYADMANLAVAKAFDVLLFVEKTTTARKNPGGPDRPPGAITKQQ